MKASRVLSLVVLGLAGVVPAAVPADAQLWWERGAATWYYKDDWKGLAISGRHSGAEEPACSMTIPVTEGAVSGWIVVWGDRGYRLFANDKPVGADVDGGLIDDYDLTPFVKGSPTVVLRIQGAPVCAEGEIVGRDGKRIPFATGEEWRDATGEKPSARKMTVGPSGGAYNRAHNGRIMTYNEEERGKASIARALGRIQRLEEQRLFLLRRYRPAADILSFDPKTPWRAAEAASLALLPRARAILTGKAIPAQKAGRFAEAIGAAGDAGALLSRAEATVAAVTALYQAEREAAHLENWTAMVGKGAAPLQADLAGLRRQLAAAREGGARSNWSALQRAATQAQSRAMALCARLAPLAEKARGPLVGGLGKLDEFPEDRFAWLNGRELIGNDPGRWPFTVLPSAGAYIDLAGQWDFRTDPDNAGQRQGWQAAEQAGAGWRKLYAPAAWERQGVMQDNPKSLADCPYRLGDARCGDKPYNGFAWYRKSVFVPEGWQGKKLVLLTGSVSNWARVFVNGTPLGDGQQSPSSRHPLPDGLIRAGAQNLIAVQVYNHDNLGGITGGPLALSIEGAEPEVRETAGPLAYVTEVRSTTSPGSVRTTLLAGALSPGVVVATDRSVLELWGWEARGYAPPSELVAVVKGAVTRTPLGADEASLAATGLSEGWLQLRGADAECLVVPDGQPRAITWRKALGGSALAIDFGRGPSRAVILSLPEGIHLDVAGCRFWAQALRRYPVSASECVAAEPAAGPLAQTCSLRCNTLNLTGWGLPAPKTVAPVPMLLSYALENHYPGARLEGATATAYHSAVAPYRVVQGTDTLTYHAPGVDRAKVMKGVGELFGKREPAQNLRGGVSEDEMFRRMGQWGFDHCRYAWAWHADWDIPLVKFMGGPLIEENDALWRRMDQFVDKCNAAGMQMMLTWFFNEDSPQKDTGGAVRNSTRYWQARPETQANAFDLWRRVAARYADRPEWAISYDFFNEPAYMNPDHWNEVMRELTRVIRAVDKKHLIVWEAADGWAQPFWCSWMKPVDDANVLYSFHHYGKHWGYAYDEYYPGYKNTPERSQIDPWLEAILFSIREHVPIHCGEFGLSMIQPEKCGEAWLEDYLAFFERFGIGWNWWNYSGGDIYRTGLAAGDRISPYVPILTKWMKRSGWGASRHGSAR